jgi:methyltransferase
MHLAWLAAAIFGSMLAESVVSRRHEAQLRADGAVEPAGDVYPLMQVAYPASFIIILAEGWMRGPTMDRLAAAGIVVFLAAKLLKYWAIRSLGVRWTFRVLVPPGSIRTLGGPYRYLRHPNYVAVMGEIAGAALAAHAPAAGVAGAAAFGALILWRIRTEERALGLPPP